MAETADMKKLRHCHPMYITVKIISHMHFAIHVNIICNMITVTNSLQICHILQLMIHIHYYVYFLTDPAGVELLLIILRSKWSPNAQNGLPRVNTWDC